jgi:hypothetical protein
VTGALYYAVARASNRHMPSRLIPLEEVPAATAE